MTDTTPYYALNNGSTQLVAMVHVGTNVALQNTAYNKLLKVPTYSIDDLKVLAHVRGELSGLHKEVVEDHKIPYLEACKSSVFLLKEKEIAPLVEQMQSLPFVKLLIDRALKETEIYVRQGISIISIENFGAPYFIGSNVSFEELFMIYIVAMQIRAQFPNIPIGMHVLSSDELESLPIAIAVKASFIRSEATVFSGFRPEGRTQNNGTLAKLFYMRNFFQTFKGVEDPESRLYPKVWSDLQKKHTVFEQELTDLSIWLNNIMFMKLEGIILTGLETGKDVTEKDLEMGRQAIDKLQEQTKKYFGTSLRIPLITGSGMNVSMYKKYADFVITGTQLKENKHWENEVSEENVKALVNNFKQ